MKKKLLNTAIDLFMKHGYEHVSVAMICKACNVTKGSFYHHYPTKDSLLVGYYEIKTNEEMTDTLTEMVTLNDSLEQMWRICNFYLQCNLSLNPELNIHLMTANMVHEGKLYPVLMENIKNYYPSVAKIIEKVTIKGQEDKQINDTCSWHVLFELYCAMYHGLLIEWSTTNGSFDITEKSRQFFLMIYSPK
ncbi:MAG: TetR/AcrR family transcriptional regulator [Anaerovoracaceae bacterium]